MTDRWEVPDSELLRQILSDPPASGLRFSRRPAQRTYFRDVYFDTAEGDLSQRGAALDEQNGNVELLSQSKKTIAIISLFAGCINDDAPAQAEFFLSLGS